MSGSAVQDAPSSVGPEFFYPDMPLEQLRRSPLNPRKHFDPAGLEELAKSIRELGIIEPLVARPVGDAYEIVAGERRYRAAQLATLTTVPVMVKALTDAQALEIMVVENNQREDVSALEEADGFSRLLKGGYDLERLAERLGRSKKYVYDRMKLLDLAPAGQQLLQEGFISAGHAILLARLKPADQARALDVDHGGVFQVDGGRSQEEEEAIDAAIDARAEAEAVPSRRKSGAAPEKAVRPDDYIGMKPRSVREVASWIAHHVRFRPQEAAAAAPLEFGEVAQRVDAAAAKPGRGKKVIPITFEHYIQPEARDEAERTFGPRSFRFADGKPHREYGDYKPTVAKTCEFSVLGVVAVGEKYGQAFEVCIARDKCQVHWKDEIAQRTKNEKLREKGQVKKAAQNEAAHAAKQAADRKARDEQNRLRLVVEDRALNQAVDGVTDLTPDLQRMVLLNLVNGDMDHAAFNRRFKTKVNWNCGPRAVKSLAGRTLVQALVFAVLSMEALNGDLEMVLKPFKVDLKAIEAAITKERAAVSAGSKKPVQTSAPKAKSAKKKR